MAGFKVKKTAVAALPDLANSIHAMEGSLGRSAAGNANYSLDTHSMLPTSGTTPTLGGVRKPQTPAQHDAVKKAAGASVAKRRMAAGLPGMASPSGAGAKTSLGAPQIKLPKI